jgi:hypothetical protein
MLINDGLFNICNLHYDVHGSNEVISTSSSSSSWFPRDVASYLTKHGIHRLKIRDGILQLGQIELVIVGQFGENIGRNVQHHIIGRHGLGWPFFSFFTFATLRRFLGFRGAIVGDGEQQGSEEPVHLGALLGDIRVLMKPKNFRLGL